MPRQLPPHSFGDSFSGHVFGANYDITLKLDSKLKIGNPYATGTGANHTINLHVPYPHRICKVEFKHTTANNVDDTTAHAFSFDRKKWGNFWFTLYADAASVVADDYRLFNENCKYPKGDYRFVINVTENYHLFIEVTIQILGKPFDASKYGHKRGKEWQ